ncbi:MAG: FtsX-like permease family protein [Acidobacteria bacterium]|nr:FtsX-like permease family protein [Acidobacteriota bacterium]
MFRGLIYHRRSHLAVVLATAVVTAVLTGALLMGDSVRGSLQDLAINRLGDVDLALVSPRFFREDLARDLAGQASFAAQFEEAVPAIDLDGAAAHATSGRLAAHVKILGVDQRFLDLVGAAFTIPPRESGQQPGAVINASLAAELGAQVGDDLIISFTRFDAIPRDTLLGRRAPEEVAGRLRLTLAGVIADSGAGRFGLTPHQGTPLNLFMDLGELQRRLERPRQANSLFLSGREGQADLGDEAQAADAAATAETLLRAALTLSDLDLELHRRGDVVVVQSREFVLRPHVEKSVKAAAAELSLPVRPVQTYLANILRSGDRQVPYSTVAAVGGPADAPPFLPLLLADGRPATDLEPDQVLLGAWAATELQSEVGAQIQVEYYVVRDNEDLDIESREFTVVGILAEEGLALDPGLTPDYPGIADAKHISDWDPPFPVNLKLIRPRDEAYWDEHRGAPKAFFSPVAAKELWSTRYGHLTSIRLGLPAGDVGLATLEQAILQRIDLAPYGYNFRAVRAEGVAGARGATDFSQLFLGFSLFLIVSAAMLVSLLFGLGVERRSREIGLLLALGYSLGRVRRRFLGEAAMLAVAGVLAGTGLGVGYAAALMAALRTIWRPAIGSSRLFLHLSWPTLMMGAAGALLVTLAAVTLTLRRVSRRPVATLLAGAVGPQVAKRGRKMSLLVAWGGLLLAVGLTSIAVLTGQSSSPGLSFGTGAGLLMAGLAFFSRWCRRHGRPRGVGNLALLGMAARNSSWSPGRSILSMALVACATFVVITVAANRVESGGQEEQLPPGAGGFALLAESSVALHQDLNDRGDRFELGLDGKAAAVLNDVEVVPFRLRPGSDASCLNLYAPGAPRLLGVPPSLARRSDFVFQKTLSETNDPWSLLDGELEPGVIPAAGDASSVQWILHLGLGQDLVMQDEAGRTLRLRIVALLSGSVFQSELLISEENFLRHFPSRSGYRFFLIKAPLSESDDVAAALESGLMRFGMDVVATKQRLAAFAAVQNTYLSTFQTLGGFGLLLGTLGLGIVLLRNVLERQGELATLQAFGFPRGRLARLILAETAFLLILGVALGSGASLLAVAPRLLAGDLVLPWWSLGQTLGLVVAVGLLSCLAAVRSALRAPLLGVLKAEN